MDITISIVSYNTKELLKRCLQSIFENTQEVRFEAIVVDNNSSDGTQEMVKKEFPKVKLIENKKNNFFARANNQALKFAKGKYFLILNSDVYFLDNSVKKIVDFLNKNENVGAVEGLEYYDDNTVIPTASRFSTPLIDFYELSLIGKRIADKKRLKDYRIEGKNRKETFSIDVGCDAFLCVRCDLLKSLKGYDEKFDLYYTENDLCLRIKKEGFEILHLGDASVIHTISSSVKKMGWKKLDTYYKDLFYYYGKNGYKFQGSLLFSLLKLEELILKMSRSNMMK